MDQRNPNPSKDPPADCVMLPVTATNAQPGAVQRRGVPASPKAAATPKKEEEKCGARKQ